MRRPPVTPHENFLDQGAEQYQVDFCEHQSHERTEDQVDVQAQKARVHNHVNQQPRHRQQADAENVIQE